MKSEMQILRFYLVGQISCFQINLVFPFLSLQPWVANNIFGLAFALNGVEFLQLNTVMTGCILLGGLFIYDIFWVFGTNVMVTVAKSFEAPIKCEYNYENRM